MKTTEIFSATLLLLLLSTCDAQRCPSYKVKVFTDTSGNSAGLSGTVAGYRRGLGGVDNANDAGPLAKGHRSINWDADVVPFNMPGNFFKVTVTRGAEFLAKGGKFVVSNPPHSAPSYVADNRFSSFNKVFPKLFRTFSPKRLFTSVKSNKFTGLFTVPVRGDKAIVTGFGAVFTNVVLKRTTTIWFYDSKGCIIFKLAAPTRAKGLSFAGIIVLGRSGKPVPKIAKVVVTLGNAAISSKYFSWKNFVVADDLVYGEPQPIKKSGKTGSGKPGSGPY